MAESWRSPVLIVAACLAGCNNMPTQADELALIATPTPESRAELESVLQQALGPREILIARDALTRSSILALEPGAGIDGPARGRLTEMPERFQLVLNGGRCYLIRVGTGDRFELEQTDCVPADR